MHEKKVVWGAFALFGAVLPILGRRCRRLAVTGESMTPALQPGDRVVAVRGLGLRPGDIVAFRDFRSPARILVKRVLGPAPEGGLIVLGDNPGRSTDSRHFGPVTRRDVVGRVVYRYSPTAERGRVARRAPGTRE